VNFLSFKADIEALNTVLKSASNEEIDSFFAGVVQAVTKERTSKESSLFMIFKSKWKEELLNQVKLIQL
jgi:predicted ABC-class ATPase